MEREGDETHVETDEARGGSTPNIVRWILIVSLLLAIILLSITWITGALSLGKQGNQATTTDRVAGAASEGETTDSMVSDGADRIQDTAPPATAESGEPTAVEN